jgi:MFS family permease
VYRSASARFLAGVAVSGFGDWLTTFALAVVLFGATGSVAATAGYFLVRVAPRPLGAWLGGPIGDVLSPRVAILSAATVQALLTAALAVPLAAGGRELWSIYLLAGLSQLVGGAWQPLTAAFMARSAAGRERHALNLVYILLSGGAILISPAIGALLLPVLGAVPLVLADAATFVVAALLFLSLPPMRGGAARRLTLRGAAWAGFDAALRRRGLRVITLGTLAATLALTALQTALPALAQQRFGSAADAGLLYASVGLGSMAGSLSALWPALRRSAVILPGLALEIAGAGLVVVLAAPVLDIVVLAGSTAAASLAQVEGGVLIQSQSPNVVGRIQGAVSTGRFLGMAGGAALSLAFALTGAGRWRLLIPVLAGAGLVVLLASSLGRRESDRVAHAAVSPLMELAE